MVEKIKLDRNTELKRQIALPRKEAEIFNSKLIVLLTGSSGVGKTTIIDFLIKNSSLFATPDQVTTRGEKRASDKEKKVVSSDEFKSMLSKGEFFHHGSSYGNFCGTTRSSIESIISSGKIPIFDFPIRLIDEIKNMNKEFNFIVIYVLPESISDWYQRMKSANRNTLKRLKDSLREFYSISDNREINMVIVNEKSNHQKAAADLEIFIRELLG